MTATQITDATRRALRQRSQGRCERCNETEAVQAHHRKPRGSGGTMLKTSHLLSCLLHVCVPCHLAIERNRARAVVHGWLVEHPGEPADVPVLMHNVNYVGPGKYLLHDDGGVTRVWDEEAA
ncbi:hypothetical protein QRX50_31480 [Amycolatopsis carbonis]|uniref:HNH endonuclease n=1 Tax=Amycolatopsis carbonis TaxID=715471 RepID=A0A9Y2I9F9_9PSEU|nr:hypothetical protein [Amycolatopsis sp. 2-15]WIX75982.1 hypothetical protein QRX50_31480 [Amycolatopsis sp. 2-15]